MKFSNIILSFLKLFLLPFSLLYGIGVRLRNLAYDRKIYRPIEFSLPVISVGNISAGGTGKTPHVEYLIELLKNKYQVATMSRGYKRKTKGFLIADQNSTAKTIGDEPLQYASKFPEVIVSVSEERIIGIPQLVGAHPEIDIILLDDAFQHRAIKPGLNILLTEFHKPFFKDYLLPFGRLRESRSGYQRADIIIVSKCPKTLRLETQQEYISKIKPLPHQQIYFSFIDYGIIYDFFNKESCHFPLSQHIILLCGIANPQPLISFLEEDNHHIELLKYPDHHFFTESNIDNLIKQYKESGDKNPVILTTEKDAMRLSLHESKLKEHQIRICVLPIRMKFLSNSEKFNNSISNFIKTEQDS